MTSLEENIKKWVLLDNNIKTLSDQIKKIRTEKHKYNEVILDYISRKELENVTIKISDGKLKFVDTNYPQPLTYKYIYECLNKYYQNEAKTLEIINFIKSERNIKTIREIKRFGEHLQ